ncbi:MAG: lipid-A-disaccharide synthase [Deltaproteobacteria bacterium]|nr:lipid-A-disaccharide synthase [Deltaproteobacteria bacterium]
MRKRRVMIVAGEASGDMHGARLVRAMRHADPELDFFGIGGSAMRQAGVRIRVDNAHIATVGVSEALLKLRLLAAALRTAKSDLAQFHPQLLIVIDFPDFNLRVAAAAKNLGIPVMYYISPQIWAWRTGRVKKIKKVVDHMVVIFPFEAAFYEKWNVPVTFVGHPLLDVAERRSPASGKSNVRMDGTVIGLLPGSRNEEVLRLLPTMVKVAERLSKEIPDAVFPIPVASSVDAGAVSRIAEQSEARCMIVSDRLHEVLKKATLLITASGTVTLEAALAGTPMIVIYRVSGLSYWLGKRLIRVRHIALANLVAGRAIVPELIQHEATVERISKKALSLISDEHALAAMQKQLGRVARLLGAAGASRRAADVAMKLLSADG